LGLGGRAAAASSRAARSSGMVRSIHSATITGGLGCTAAERRAATAADARHRLEVAGCDPRRPVPASTAGASPGSASARPRSAPPSARKGASTPASSPTATPATPASSAATSPPSTPRSRPRRGRPRRRHRRPHRRRRPGPHCRPSSPSTPSSRPPLPPGPTSAPGSPAHSPACSPPNPLSKLLCCRESTSSTPQAARSPRIKARRQSFEATCAQSGIGPRIWPCPPYGMARPSGDGSHSVGGSMP